jgi:hypothetical protein
VQTHSLKARALIFCLLLMFLAAGQVHAAGQAESRLAEAQRLIDQQDYSGALKLLAIIQRDNPDLRDETAKLMLKVMTVTQRYNEALARLNQAKVEGDVAGMQRYLEEIRAIDPKRSSEIAGTAGVLVGLMKLMNDAEAQLAAGRLTQALALYVKPLNDPAGAGFTLPAKDFQSAGYGSLVVAEVGKVTAGITAEAAAMAAALDTVLAAPAALGAVISRQPPAEAADFDAAAAPLLRAASAEGYVKAAAMSLLDIGGTIRVTTGKGKDDPYLQFLSWLVLGREGKDEGMVTVLHRAWAEASQAAAAQAAALEASAFASAVGLYAAGSLDRAETAFAQAGGRALLSVKAAALASAILQASASTGWRIAEDQRPTLGSLAAQASVAQEHAAEIGGYGLLLRYRRELAAFAAVDQSLSLTDARAAAEAERLRTARAALDARTTEARDREREWSGRALAWEAKARAGAAAASTAASASGVAALFGSFADAELRRLDLAYALRVDAIGGAGFPRMLSDAVAARARGLEAAAGATSATGTPEKHPEKALASFLDAEATLGRLIDGLTAHMSAVRADKPYVLESEAFKVLFAGDGAAPGYDALLDSARRERSDLPALMAAAQNQLDGAAIANRQGDTDYERALAAYAKNDPSGASSFLDSARDAYNKSLESAYSEHASTRVEKDLNDLDVKIGALTRKIAIDAAQKAIAAINRKLVDKDYLGASDDLDTAERTWNETGQGSYPSFDILRQNIQNALDLSQGRTLDRLDPKAAVVTAFMNNAQAALEAGRLEDATRNVLDALAVAPNYGAAKVLKLQIQKRTDPVGFQKEAAAQIAMYLKMAQDAGNRQGQREAYLALLDYSKLDPAFAAQTKAAVQELEYQLGLARRPATPQQVAQSNALVQEADQLAQQGTTEGYNQALERIRQALQVNPDNTAAIRLDAQVRTRLSNVALTALSAADSVIYNQAYSDFLSGAYQDAYDKVGTLWRSARNQTFAPLQKLKKRCEVALNLS